jgi:hypothetical protein
VQQARNLLMDLEDAETRAKFVLHDRDASFTLAFDAVFQAAGVRVIRSVVQPPRMNSIMKRWIGSCRRELLDRTLIWNQRHLMIVLREYEDFYKTHRPHRTLSQAAPLRPLPDSVADLDQFRVQRRDRAGGVIHEYRLLAQVLGTHKVSGRFCRLPPKDDSYRSTNVEPLTPVDLPPFLTGLLAAQAGKHARQRCTCAAEHGGSGRYLFLGPDSGHHRNSNYARRIFRPARDGRHPPANGRPARLVTADTTAWPGTPAAAWPPAVPGKLFAPPSGRGSQRLIGTGDTVRCPSCGHAVRLRVDGRIIAQRMSPVTARAAASSPPATRR